MKETENQEQLAFRESLKKVHLEHPEEVRQGFDALKKRHQLLDALAFRAKKESIRGKDQLIPPEYDLAFLDEQTGEIFINTDTTSADFIDEILEHEAAEMVKRTQQEGSDLSKKEQQREAHQLALLFEYRRAKENGHLEAHHAWIIAFLEKLGSLFPENEPLQQAIARQKAERQGAVDIVKSEKE